MKAVITVGDVEQELGNLDELIDNLNKDASRSVYIEWNITAFKSKERLIQ